MSPADAGAKSVRRSVSLLLILGQEVLRASQALFKTFRLDTLAQQIC